MKLKIKLFDISLLTIISLLFFHSALNIYFLSEDIAHINSATYHLFNSFLGYYYRPVWALTLIIDKFIWEFNYAGYHFSNIIFHTITSLLIYVFAHQFLKDRFFALASSLLFLVHPIHSISIFFIAGRTDVLCAMLYMGSLILFLQYFKTDKRIFQIFSLLFFGVALFSKEMAISLPAVLFLYAFIFVELPVRNRIVIAFQKSYPHILLLIIFLLSRIVFIGDQAMTNIFHSNLNIVQLIKNFSTFFGLLIIPGGHISIANYLNENPFIYISASVLSLIAFLISIKWLKKSKLFLFSVLFLIVALIPVIRLVMRFYLYIPSIGFCLIIGYFLYILNQRIIFKMKMGYLLLIMIFIIYGGFLKKEMDRWIHSGKVAKEISYKIARTISKHNFTNYLFLNIPAELEEVVVMMFGQESLINFRLQNDFGAKRKIDIEMMSYISLAKEKDMDAIKIHKRSAGTYELDLSQTDSKFAFPHHSEVVNKRRRLKEWDILFNDFTKTQIEGLNKQGEVNKVRLEAINKSVPILYYDQGTIKLDNNES